MEKVCKNCGHWKRRIDCTIEKFIKIWSEREFGDCHCEKFEYNPYSEVKENDGLTYADSEACEASFQTGENFGCIHFKLMDGDK